MNPPRTRIKTGPASLIGGIAVAAVSFILWVAVTHELAADTTPVLIVGLCVAAGIGIWIRVADL
jgi:protein-S-isoprenylcysteine O-methyltransferase Ste14